MLQPYPIWHWVIAIVLTVSATLAQSKMSDEYDPWSAVDISPVALYQIDYGSRRVEIREHVQNRRDIDGKRKKYYIAPLSELVPSTATSKWNNETQEFEVRFAVRMWDDQLIETAWAYLKDNEEPNLPLSRVQMLPIQSLALRCTGCTGFGLNGNAMRVSSLPRIVYFTLSSETADGSDRLLTLMKTDPEHFKTLRLVFALQGQRLEKKVVAVEFDVTLNGEFYSEIKRQFPGKVAVYLLLKEEERLKRQFLRDLLSEHQWESSEIQDNHVKAFKIAVHSFLVESRHDASHFSQYSWNVLLWYNDAVSIRPDLLAKELTDIQNGFTDPLVQTTLQNWFQDPVPTIESDDTSHQLAEVDIRKAFQVNNTTEFVRKAREFVRWNGTHFVPNPLLVTRINLYERIDSQNNGSFQFTVKFYPAALDRDVSVLTEDLPDQRSAILAELSTITKTNITKEIQHLKARIMESEMVQTARKQYLATGDALATNASILMDRQDLANLASLVAHYHSKEYIPNEPSWYSSVRLSLNDAINSLSQYGLVSYLPPAEPLWVTYINGDDATLALNNFWGRSTNKSTTIKLSTANTSFVWDPVNDKVLFFNGKNLREFPYEQSRHYNREKIERIIYTDGPWRQILDLSFDWNSRNLFILSSTNYFIFVLSIEKPYTWTQLKCSQTNDVIEKIQVDPTGGYLFWAAESSYIRRSWLNGSNLTTVWSPERPYNISAWSLTIDHETGTLYTVDSTQKVLLELNREGDLLRTIPLKWANGEEANLFATNRNLNKVPNGLVVVDEENLYFIDLRTEIVHVLDHEEFPTTTRYHVFYPNSKSYPLTTNPCSREKTSTCLQRPDYYNSGQECIEYKFTPTACGDSVCLHNPTGNYTCH